MSEQRRRRRVIAFFFLLPGLAWGLVQVLGREPAPARDVAEAPTVGFAPVAPPVQQFPRVDPAPAPAAVEPAPRVAMTVQEPREAATPVPQQPVAQTIADAPVAVTPVGVPPIDIRPIDVAPAPVAPRDAAPLAARTRAPLPQRFSLAIRSGSFRPRASGALFDRFATSLTLNPGDLQAQSIGVDVSWMLAPRVEIVAAVEGSSASALSEARAARPGGGLPVRQSTALTLEPVGTVALRYYLVPPFRWSEEAGWVPEPSRVFVGAGAGMLGYALRQSGEFVDERQSRAFSADLESRGVGRIGYLSTGIEVPTRARVSLLAEARYQWSHAPLAAGFAAFDQVDLSGLRLTFGLQRRW